jgi:23S rRNA pseudouridine1911/1915/1917 synthase
VPERKYYAVVEGRLDTPSGRIISHLAENKVFKVYATTPDQGREAILEYRELRVREGYSLLEIELETGRKNQIRAQMEAVGHPIAGDRKYGAQTNPLGRVALHAGTITFVHPLTGEILSFETPLPYKFNALFGRR